MERRPAVGAAGVVEAQAALGRLEGGLEEDLLHGVGVAALGGEEETSASNDTVGAEGEEGGNLRTGGDGTSSDDERAVGTKGGLDFLDDGEDGGRD